MTEFYSRDSRRLVPQRRLYLRVLGNRSSSSKTPLRVRLPAPGPGKWCRECTERNNVTQQINQSYPAPGNWSEVLSHVLRKPEFKVDLRIEGIAQDVILKDEEWTGKIQEKVRKRRKWFTHEIYIGRSGKTRKTPWYSARNPVASSMKWATSSCTTWDR